MVACLIYEGVAYSQQARMVTTLTLCEALRNLNAYHGQTVVIVSHSYYPIFHGPHLYEKCEYDGLILIQKHRWLSMMELDFANDLRAPGDAFPVEEALLWNKLKEVKGYVAPVTEGTELATPGTVEAPELEGDYVAVYGRVESPVRLKPEVLPGGPNASFHSGNGYGVNGSVPARILVIHEKTLIRGHSWRVPRKQPPLVVFPEPPVLAVPELFFTIPRVSVSPQLMPPVLVAPAPNRNNSVSFDRMIRVEEIVMSQSIFPELIDVNG